MYQVRHPSLASQSLYIEYTEHTSLACQARDIQSHSQYVFPSNIYLHATYSFKTQEWIYHCQKSFLNHTLWLKLFKI